MKHWLIQWFLSTHVQLPALPCKHTKASQRSSPPLSLWWTAYTAWENCCANWEAAKELVNEATPIPGVWWCPPGPWSTWRAREHVRTAGSAGYAGGHTWCSRRCPGSCWSQTAHSSAGSLSPAWPSGESAAPRTHHCTGEGLQQDPRVKPGLLHLLTPPSSEQSFLCTSDRWTKLHPQSQLQKHVTIIHRWMDLQGYQDHIPVSWNSSILYVYISSPFTHQWALLM